ncbi:MAG: hypothetical protein A2729_02305 [Candidatus Buchananbacteria bacterium RIFCSPHIGHO2_01_FULL_39_14]|uniref:Sortilin N-terminal domain-containing protein n=2 Tax=Candidatus Buchananiibacteriota TaxID=1817903 RepID=A0A1G1YPU4_9BACT|nr:MAG: hypothetical protein A2729_02305 [Candidatus Buchananbacteria bacterium RIFCSPHIGHO2_01_FULL_39_14]OGY48858.1 MAG: hypothetical protein A3D39_01015 [Candidatus Buchananbacteria bacterium RIFCSPHIGHO2_02_FULL_39_17]OGY54378.1 MAG: hypothetical protein A2912_02125 [Candidatus Buchananbacteria bacterium RIFCSPLOWO2_01_FULL_40_23b]
MKKTLILLAVLTLTVSGCIRLNGPKSPSAAGVFKSFDKGNTWAEKNLFLHSGGSGSIAGVNVLNLNFDPQDRRAIYLASDGAGLLYSYDGADSWRKADQVGNGRIESVAIDSKNKCVIYTTFANTILKSVDCNRSWSEVYIDTRADKTITALAVDNFNNLIVYAGNSVGDILKSVDGGGNWQVIGRLNDRVTKILISPQDTRIIYVATRSKGIFKTTNAGNQWNNLNDGLKQFSASLEYRNLIFDATKPNSLLYAAKYGLLKSDDGGQSWTAINLITPPASVDILALAISPKNNLEIYYATTSTFYKTIDGGKNWITKRLPSGAVAAYLVVDPLEDNVIYFGLANPTRK